MKTLTRYIEEKLIIKQRTPFTNNTQIANYILKYFNIVNPSINFKYGVNDKLKRLNRLSQEKYDELLDSMKTLFNECVTRDIYDTDIVFKCSRRCGDWVDDDEQGVYELGTVKSFNGDIMKRMFDSEHFIMFSELTEDMLRIMYYRPLNDIVLICEIKL